MQLYLQGKQSGEQTISETTVAELNNIDQKKEEDRIKQETLDRVRRQQTLEEEIRKIQDNMAQQVQTEAQEGVPYNQQQRIGQADQIVQQLMQLEPGMRKSHLEALKVEDFVMYSIVIQRLEMQQSTLQGHASAGMVG